MSVWNGSNSSCELRVSCEHSPGDYSQPNRKEPYDYTEGHGQSGSQKLAFLEDTKSFILECGESAIATYKPNGN
jgi:hypothetical protein